MGLQTGEAGLWSLAENIRDLSSLWVAILQEWEEMMCHSRVARCAEQSLKLREAPISERAGWEGRTKTHVGATDVTLGDPSPLLQPPVGTVSLSLSTC